ncbi:MAG: Rpp14/Pop5 family protein [Nanoarchaeota archaeon]
MPKIKQLLPSLREKKRYLAFEILSNKPLMRDVGKDVKKGVEKTLGLFDSASAGIMLMKYNTKTQRGIMKMAHTYVDKVRVSLMLMNAEDIDFDDEISIATLKVSGNMSKLAHYAG